MRTMALIALLAASTCCAQEAASNPQPQPPVPTQAPTTSQQLSITIPAGTRIPLSLTSPISTKARRGNNVRAVTGFPVTVGTQVAIPVGTYLEGVIDKLSKGGRSGPSVQMHFTRLLFANGYSVSIDANNTEAKARSPNSSPTDHSAFVGEKANSLAAGSSSQLPTVQPPSSHTGAIVGLAVGGAAASAAIVILDRRHAGSGGVLFDAGWQFEVVLASPLSVDVASVAAAAAISR